MKFIRRWALPLVLLVGCVGCIAPRGTIHVDNIGELIDTVSDRHDVYVLQDNELTDLQRHVYLRSTELLRKVVEEARQ